ncbi:hypothetical protein [Microbacterium sp. A1-JK]|uniref:hypothetical protein n=1 Tax=Microbacterium sp. A1-JK TaxID=3177516 RepID=UPI003889B01F
MGMDWLYGPERTETGKADANVRRDFLRSMTLDVEVLRDIREDIEHQAKQMGGAFLGGATATSVTYSVGGRQMAEEKAFKLGILDRDRIDFAMVVNGSGPDADGPVTLQIQCQEAAVSAFPYGDDMAAMFASQMRETAIRRLISSGSPRTSWVRVSSLAVWLFPAAALALWVWLSSLVTMPAPAHLLAGVVFIAAVVGVRKWSMGLARQSRVKQNSFHFRGQSREETWRDRAARGATARTIFWTAVATIPTTFLGAYLTAYFTGDFAPGPAPTP